MPDKLECTFYIKRVKKTTDMDYINALIIYFENNMSDIRTTSNELSV